MTGLRELWRRQSDSWFARRTLHSAARRPECRAAALRYRYAHRLFAARAVLRMTFCVDGEKAVFILDGDPVEVVLRAALTILRRDLLSPGDPPGTDTPSSGSM